jgi:cytochrome c oxidase subunit 4
MSEHSAAKHPSVETLIAVFVALMALLGATVAVAEIDLGGPWNFAAATAIAATKAVLIVLFFMNIRYSGALARLVAAAGFFWLVILFALTFADYWTRGGLPVTQSW